MLALTGDLMPVQAAALQQLLGSELGRVGTVTPSLETPTPDAVVCDQVACLKERAGTAPIVIALSTVRFEDAWVITAIGWSESHADVVVSSSEHANNESGLPAAVTALAKDLVNIGLIPASGSSSSATAAVNDAASMSSTANDQEGVDISSVLLALKFGSTIPALTGTSLKLSSLNLRFDFEADYQATQTFWPFVDASLLLGHNDQGQSLQLVPVLLGAKYVFRPGAELRPYAGLGVGLGFLTGSILSDSSQTTSFAVYGVGGVHYLPWTHVGFLVEGSLNLSGIQLSAQTGVLFAFSFNFGVFVVF